ncbi:MAG TPA: alkaline phosphatase D family protein [Polyangiaceae bacterium LLY-WYZ-14_1]|nr:alkaline phosphatase D family protein [Polyangiaceae bacterium LLY-WYZ-14_1]
MARGVPRSRLEDAEHGIGTRVSDPGGGMGQGGSDGEDDGERTDGGGLGELMGVGAVTTEAVRVFVRSPVEGSFVYRAKDESLAGEARAPRGEATDFTSVFEIDGLRPGTRYAVDVEAPGGARRTLRFRTSTRRGERTGRVAVAVASCHQPFDGDGRVHREAVPMLTATDRLLRELDVDALFLVGDQVYADEPEGRSLFDPEHFAEVGPRHRQDLFDCTREEVRRLFQGRSRAWLGLPAFEELCRGRPTYMMVDDHEVVDNFGTDPAHGTERWAPVRDGALDATFDYQALRAVERPEAGHRPSDFDFQLRTGGLAVYGLDLRSQRRATEDDAQVVSSGQLRALEGFLAEHEDASVACLVLSVPLVHVPRWLADAGALLEGVGGNAEDRWSHEKNRGDRRALIELLTRAQRRAPGRRLVFLGGDVHVGAVSRFDWTEPGLPPTYQLVSSALTNVENPLFQAIAVLGAGISASLPGEASQQSAANVELLSGVEGVDTNPYGGLNVGILEVFDGDDGRDDAAIRMRLFGWEDGRLEPVFDSGER